MILYYNKQGIGDTLICYLKDGTGETFERRSDVARIFDSESGETLGYNFFNASEWLSTIQDSGRIIPDGVLLNRLNDKITGAGFQDLLESDRHALIVTGYVASLKKHPDSDHLHICQVDVGGEQLQIVCGAPNIGQGQKVVVARIGALMPNGQIIRPSVLRGVASDGMICSARELALPGAPQKRGILILDDRVTPGLDFYAYFNKEKKMA
jgi:tRNA-binding protein